MLMVLFLWRTLKNICSQAQGHCPGLEGQGEGNGLECLCP